MLETDFAAPTLHSDGVAHVQALPAGRRAHCSRSRAGSPGLQVQICTYSFGAHADHLAEDVRAATEYGLKLDFNPTAEQARGERSAR